MGKAPMQSNNIYSNVKNVFQKNDFKSGGGNMKVNNYSGNVVTNKELGNNNDNLAVYKRFKTPACFGDASEE